PFCREDQRRVQLVCKLDRLARSTRDLLNTLATIGERGATFKSLGEVGIGPSLSTTLLIPDRVALGQLCAVAADDGAVSQRIARTSEAISTIHKSWKPSECD